MTVGTTPEVRYNYYHGGGNRIRMAGMTYPNGRSLTYDYGVADGMNDACSRIESIINDSDSLNLATYQYLGASGFVNVASSQPGINWTLYGTTNDPNTGDIYSGLDRFGRVDNCLWQKQVGLITTTLAQIQYGYDRASNRTWRKDGVLTLLLAGYDELYAYDGLYRLNDQKRGTLNGTQTAITSGTFEQQWGLDSTGNWKTFKQDNDGNGTWELNQTRTTNKANEITGITNSVGAAWATPTYDPAGNMTGIPNPQSLTAQYDAWNRMVSISDGAATVSQHVYDARGFRIRKDTYTSGTLSETRHYYYTPGWQCVEERTGTLTTVERQFVWGLRYIDDLVMRDRSTANNGVINERRYAMQDGNWNTIAICDITGFVSERFAYSAYGTPVFMTGAGVVQSASTVGFETLYAGYRWDGTTPQMYYVRNRFLLPMIGTWNRRDPLGYVDGMNLYENCYSNGIVWIDSAGLQGSATMAPPRTVRPSPVRPSPVGPSGTPGGGPTGQANGPQGGTYNGSRPIYGVPPNSRNSGWDLEDWFEFIGSKPARIRPGSGPRHVGPTQIQSSISSVLTPAPQPIHCADPGRPWPQTLVPFQNDPGSRNCQNSLGFPNCRNNSSVQEVLENFTYGFLRNIGADLGLQINLINCRTAVEFAVGAGNPSLSGYCNAGSPAFNTHCQIAIRNNRYSSMPIFILVNSPEISTTCCLCCRGRQLGIHCGDPHVQTTATTNRRQDNETLRNRIRETIENAGL